ncbi:unnamed protein product, partial [Durusdinium trenchii]
MFGEGEDALKPAASQASGSWEHVPEDLSSLIVDLEDQGQEPDGHSPKPSSVADDTPIDADDEFDGDADLRGFRLKWSKKRRTAQEPVDKDRFGNDGCLSSSPSSTLPAVSSNVDDALSLASAMADRIVASSIVLPWESELMSPIFGSVVGQPKLAMPANWSVSFDNPLQHPIPEVIPQVETQADFSVLRCVRNAADLDFLQARAKTMKSALAKLRCVLEIDWSASEVGRQCIDGGGQLRSDCDDVINSIIGTKSPSTIVKRRNAIFAFQRWLASFSDEPAFPLQGSLVWDYFAQLKNEGAAPTRATSFVQALRFCLHVLQVDGAQECVASRRLIGQSELQAAMKRPTQQARPLTVEEVQKLSRIMSDAKRPLHERVICSHLVLMVYTRSRNSDSAFAHDISHDHSERGSPESFGGFIQFTTRYHKAARSVEAKSMLMPIIACGESVGPEPWLDMWLTLRKKSKLPTSGIIDGAVMPAPDLVKPDRWAKRHLSCAETTKILRTLLNCNDHDLRSHSLKRTALSWAAKAGVNRDHRRLLGRHASAVQDSDSIYATDLMVEPVRSLGKVIRMIRNEEFCPDKGRSDFFAARSSDLSGAPIFQPSTPGFLRAPPTPAVVTAEREETGPDTDVKQEVVPADLLNEEIDLVSSSSETSTEGLCAMSLVAMTSIVESEAHFRKRLFQRLRAPLQLTSNPVQTLDKGSKLLAILPGAVLDQRGEDDPPPAVLSLGDNSEDSATQLWGIPWTPEEFFEEAVKAGHPKAMGSFLPKRLEVMIDQQSFMSAEQRNRMRLEKLAFFLKRAHQLRSQEADFKQTLHPDVRKILKSKRILLWQEMLQSINYEDMGVVTEFYTGTQLVGEAERTSLWPFKFTPASMTPHDLSQVSESQRPLITYEAFSFMDQDVISSAWEQTLAERDAGESQGIAHSLWAILVSVFGVCISNYFDDFIALAERPEVEPVTSAVTMTFKTLGWDFAETGDKAPPFGSLVTALGVQLDVACMHNGRVLIDNTKSRKTELIHVLEHVLEHGTLNRRDALRLRGRLQFVSGQIYGRIAKKALAIITQHAYGNGGTELSHDSVHALQLFVRLLQIDVPREISVAQQALFFLFTDTSYEQKDGSPIAGLGAVLADQYGKKLSFFSTTLTSAQLEKVNPAGRKTVIFECELLSIFVAMFTWKQVLENSQVVVYTDNE